MEVLIIFSSCMVVPSFANAPAVMIERNNSVIETGQALHTANISPGSEIHVRMPNGCVLTGLLQHSAPTVEHPNQALATVLLAEGEIFSAYLHPRNDIPHNDHDMINIHNPPIECLAFITRPNQIGLKALLAYRNQAHPTAGISRVIVIGPYDSFSLAGLLNYATVHRPTWLP